MHHHEEHAPPTGRPTPCRRPPSCCSPSLVIDTGSSCLHWAMGRLVEREWCKSLSTYNQTLIRPRLSVYKWSPQSKNRLETMMLGEKYNGYRCDCHKGKLGIKGTSPMFVKASWSQGSAVTNAHTLLPHFQDEAWPPLLISSWHLGNGPRWGEVGPCGLEGVGCRGGTTVLMCSCTLRPYLGSSISKNGAKILLDLYFGV